MYIQQIIDDITKYRNYNITFIKNNITHLYYRKYIFSIRVGNINYSCTKKEDYKTVMKKIKDAIQSFSKIRSIICHVNAAESLEVLDTIILQDKEKSKYGLNLPIKVYNRTPPIGSTKFRVKMIFHPHLRQVDLIDNMTTIVEMLKQSFGDDHKNSTYVFTNGIPAYRKPTVYINFKNEDDIIFIQPYTSLDRLQSIKLEVFDGQVD